MNDSFNFQVLQCPCHEAATEFLQVLELKWKPSGGLVQRPIGFECRRCGKMANVESLIRDVKRRHLEQQMEELQSEQQNYPIELERVNEEVAGSVPDKALGGDSVSHVGNAAGKAGLS